jgi:tryptophan synthase alpha chain
VNRIIELFKNKQKKILSIYFTAGHPELESTLPVLKALEKSGVDMIEIGIPFSDPLADGPVIQQSSQKALQNGMTLRKLLNDLKSVRQEIHIPLLLMGYFNIVLQFGVEDFCRAIAQIGMDGVILPDMPLEVYAEQYQTVFEEYDIIPVFLITPGTSDERIRLTEKYSKGFIYMVSSASVTGAKKGFGENHLVYFNRIKKMNLSVPVVAGFGISDKFTFDQVSEFAAGGIIGSAFVTFLEEEGASVESIGIFINRIIE